MSQPSAPAPSPTPAPPWAVLLALLLPCLVAGYLGYGLGAAHGGAWGGVGGAALGAAAGLAFLFGLGVVTVHHAAHGEGARDAQGRRQGLWTATHPDGSRRQERTFRDGQEDGPAASWHPNGQKAAEGAFRLGAQDGPWLTWYPDGTPETEAHYHLGQPHGPWRSWHPNGQPWVTAAYHYGSLHGPWQAWSPAGDLRFATEYVCGVPLTRGPHRPAAPAPAPRNKAALAGWLLATGVCLASLVRDPLLLVGVAVLVLVVFLHELGHFLAALAVGIPVQRFRVGVGPNLVRFAVGRTLYELNLVPILGFVQEYALRPAEWAHVRAVRQARRAGAPAPPPPETVAGETRQPVSQFLARPRRLVFLLGGVAFNYLTAVGVAWGLDPAAGLPAAAGRVHDLAGHFLRQLPQVLAQELQPGARAEREPGALAVMREAARSAPADPPRPRPQPAPRPAATTPAPAPAAAPRPAPLPAIPALGVWKALATFLMLFSLGALCFNLLPIPGLDGFHVLRLLIEAVLRRPIPDRLLVPVFLVGLLLLGALMLGTVVQLGRDVLEPLLR